MMKSRSILKNIIMFISLTSCIAFIAGCKGNDSGNGSDNANGVTNTIANEGAGDSVENEDNTIPTLTGSMELEYAKEFSVNYYEGGYASIHIGDGNSYVLVPEGCDEIILDDENATFIHMPCNDIYLAASSAMDLFNELDGLDNIKCCSTKAEDYSNTEVRDRINSGKITYVGKYSAPDYERLLTSGIDIAIESTMIYHSPKIKEELNQLGIPVLVERSSYETDPLGRLEWIKLYGLLLGKSELANEIFDTQVLHVESVIAELDEMKKGSGSGNASEPENAGESENASESVNTNKPKVAVFYISSSGYINVRKPGDYVSKMIETAGGQYAFDSLKIEEENALSTVNISWEDFYLYGKDADIIIYNGTIDGGITSIDELIKQNALFSEFKAIKNSKVYCLGNDLYQESSKTGDIILELFYLFKNEDTNLKYIKPIK